MFRCYSTIIVGIVAFISFNWCFFERTKEQEEVAFIPLLLCKSFLPSSYLLPILLPSFLPSSSSAFIIIIIIIIINMIITITIILLLSCGMHDE